MFTILCLLCLCGKRNREYPSSFQNKSVSFSFKWADKYIMFLAKLKREGRSFWNGQAKIYPLNSLTCEGNVNYYKSVHHPIPILPVGIGSTLLAIFKKISLLYFQPFNWVSRYILFLAKLKERGRLFLEGARMGTTLWDYPQKYLVPIWDEKVSPFVKFEIILPILCFLLDPLTNKHIRT